MSLLTIFQLYLGDSFIGGGNRSTWRKRVLTTDLSQITDKIYRIMLYRGAKAFATFDQESHQLHTE
jgi:hypothetical protein